MSSIRRRLFRSLFGWLLALFAIIGAGFTAYLNNSTRTLYDDHLLSLATSIAASCEIDDDDLALQFHFIELVEGILSEVPTIAELLIDLRLRDGTSLFQTEGLEGARMPEPPAEFMEPKYSSLTLADGSRWRAITVRFRPAVDPDIELEIDVEQPHYDLVVNVLSPSESVDRITRNLIIGFVISGLLLAVGAALIVRGTIAVGLRPLNSIATATRGIDTGDLSRRFETSGLPDEIVPLTRRLNDLLDRIDAGFRRERRFTSDVAHELRTPIASLKVLAELGSKLDPDANTDEDFREYFRDATELAVRLEKLVTTLLGMVRSEAGQLNATLVPVDLARLLGQVIDAAAPAAGQRQLQWAREWAEPAMVTSDPALLRAVLENVVDNTVSYAPSGSGITARISGEGEALVVAVENPAPGMTAEEAASVFEPFWRRDASRSDSSHSGLGLSLVRAYAVQLGIDVRAELAGEGRFRLTLRIPTAPRPSA